MFSWKKQNPPSKQRQQQSLGGDYSDLIAQGMKLANEDIDESGDGAEYMGDGDEDLGDMDLDDPDLLTELQGLTGELQASKPKPTVGLTQPSPKPSSSASIPTTTERAAPVAKTAPAKSQSSVQPSPNANTQANPMKNPALAGLGLDLDSVMEDNDDEEVELTEDDWNDPHLMAQLQSLGGDAGGRQDKEILGKRGATSANTNTLTPELTPLSAESKSPLDTSNINTSPSLPDRKRASASSSMIAIPPQDKAYNDEDMDDDSLMTDHTEESKTQPDQIKVSSPEVKPPKRVETIPKTNSKDLLKVLQTREAQYKRAALDAKQAGNMSLATERMRVYKALQGWIKLVAAGGFLDLEIYPIPDEPPVVVASSQSTPQQPKSTSTISQPTTMSTSSTAPLGNTSTNSPNPKSHSPPIISLSTEPTTQVSNSIAEATSGDMWAGSGTRGISGIQFSQLKADDDFQIVSNSDTDTYDMLESQLESQIKMCESTLRYYHQIGDKNTALQFHKLNKTFKADLVSLRSHRSHGKKAPAFHFQDVRFELEHGFYQEIGPNDLSLNIIKAWDLSHKDVQPADIDAYVIWDLGWPTENMAGAGSGKGTTPSIKKTARPEFNYSKTLGIERSKAFHRFVERRKITFEVWHYRGLLWKDYLIGRGQIALQPLMNHSEIHEIVPLLDATNRKNTGGKLEIRIRLQRPLQKPEIVIKEEKWLVIDAFNFGGLGFPSPVSITPPMKSSGSPAQGRGTPGGKATKAVPTTPAGVTRSSVSAPSARTATTPPTAPTAAATPPQAATKHSPKSSTADQSSTSVRPGQTPATPSKFNAPQTVKNSSTPAVDIGEEESESDKALNELNSVELLVSNMVLENEIQIAQQMIHDAKAVGKSEAAEEYQDRLVQLEIKLKLLVLQVQTGGLTMDVYCRSVYDRIAKDKQLAISLKKLGMIPEAKRALGRSKIMTQEMKEVEEAMAAQGEEEEE
ncbi:Coiled-coil and C2 domain-containing protein 1B [Linnemannia zychae]|nr:Coiled-coil and C2 domain-containing protein 1B [Linnemannia zychae]